MNTGLFILPKMKKSEWAQETNYFFKGVPGFNTKIINRRMSFVISNKFNVCVKYSSVEIAKIIKWCIVCLSIKFLYRYFICKKIFIVQKNSISPKS